MAFRIAHISDIHFGKIRDPKIVDALIDEVNRADVDLTCVSGDLTQRARTNQFRDAAEMLSRIRSEILVVPGNHDVYAWWFPFRRLGDALRRYREFISDDLAPHVVADGVRVLGINSAHGWTIAGGRIAKSEHDRITEFFSSGSDTAFKVLVVHHHLSKIEALGPHDVARNARRTLDVAVNVGVDLILCGHLHISHIEHVEIIPADHRLVIVSAGTATSTRGRKEHRRSNFYNIIDVREREFVVEERRFDIDRGRFISDCETRFERIFDTPSADGDA